MKWKATAFLTYVGTNEPRTAETVVEADNREEAEKIASDWACLFDHEGYWVDGVKVEPIQGEDAR